MAVHTWTVDEVCAGVFAAIEAIFPDEFWVRGEIQGLRKSPAGHLYFDLVEPGARGRGQDAKLGTVAFRGPLRGIEAVLRKVGDLELTDGLEVRVRGKVDYYPPQGRVQFIMSAIDPRHTLGQLGAERDRVLTALATEKLIDRNRSLTLPLVPLKVGLVTSDDSAAYNDFVHELEASGYGFHVVLADARVQGIDAEPMLVAAMTALSRHDLDVIAMVRGGGSRGDLLAFDKESVARAVATASVPVFVGIGHEIDRSVVDEVAHSTLKTPTACATALVERVSAFSRRLTEIAAATRHHGDRALRLGRERLDTDAARLRRATTATLNLNEMLLDRHAAALVSSTSLRLSGAEATLDRAAVRLPPTAIRLLDRQSTKLRAAESVVTAVHPARTLARGYSITRSGGAVVRSVRDVAPGQGIITEVIDGTIDGEVTFVTSSPSPNPSPHDRESTDV